MNFQLRSCTGVADLLPVGQLLRRAFARNASWNAWSVARYDIWAQRRIADAICFGHTEWQEHMALWQNDAGALVGAAAFTELSAHCWDPNAVALFTDPAYPELLETMLEWAEAHHAATDDAQVVARLAPKKVVPRGALNAEVFTGNTGLEEMLQSRGYKLARDWMFKRSKMLDPAPEQVCLPAGFVLKNLTVPADSPRHFASVAAVFRMQESVEAYSSIQRAPSYVPDLDIVIVAPDGTVACFGTLWVDTANHFAEFEPVGTHPAYRRQGLARALIAELCNRLRAHGITRVGVDSWSESPPANALYDAAGLLAHAKLRAWESIPT